jgi:hypothetical protein
VHHDGGENGERRDQSESLQHRSAAIHFFMLADECDFRHGRLAAEDAIATPMNRRQTLKALGAIGGAAVLGRFALLPPGPSRTIADAHDLARRFFDSLGAAERKRACVPYDDPMRQYHNRGVWGGGLWVNPLSLGWEQRRTLTDLVRAGLSEAGRERVPNEHFVKWPGVHAMHVLVCGDPHRPPYQVILTGPHLNLRMGSFGGPLVYGDQAGDGIAGLPGNAYRFQLAIAEQLWSSLRSGDRELALLPTSPIQTDIQPRGSDALLPGAPVTRLTPEGRAHVRALVDAMLSTYPAEDVASAWEQIEANGGVERMVVSFYADSALPGGRCPQNVRVEGPGAVFYFRGAPHVHAFVYVVRDPDAPLGIGKTIGTTPNTIEGDGVRRLFETALRHELGTDLAYYPRESVAGRLRKGPIREGDIYSLESWQDRAVVAEMRGADLPSFLREEGIDPRRTYTVATTGEAIGDLGNVAARHARGRVRDIAIAYWQTRSFSAIG